VAGLLIQIALVAALAATVGVGVAGWLVASGYALVTCAALGRGLRRRGTSFGPANWVTLIRATLVGCVAALTADSVRGHPPVGVVVAISVVALLLDAVDGQVARRSGAVSALGARFDMEVDAFLLLVLGVFATPRVGAWVLAIGGMRYAFGAAGWALPWMRGKLPFRYWRKVVTAAQGVALVIAAADVFPEAVTLAAPALALALLVESFGRDVIWLWRHRPRPAATPAAARVPGATARRAGRPPLAPGRRPH
jgi:phosphatidylglycerophosphate synthase